MENSPDSILYQYYRHSSKNYGLGKSVADCQNVYVKKKNLRNIELHYPSNSFTTVDTYDQILIIAVFIEHICFQLVHVVMALTTVS